MRTLSLLICALLLSACSGSFYLAGGGGAAAPAPAAANPTAGPNGLRASINTTPSPWFSALILGLMLADGVDQARHPGQWTRVTHELDESRRISVQDCSQPVDVNQGNIRCR